jgi:hypothetical protein
VLRLAHLVAIQGIASVVAAIVDGGLGGRLPMRLSALAAGPDMVGRITDNSNRIGTISVDGTLELIIFWRGALWGLRRRAAGDPAAGAEVGRSVAQAGDGHRIARYWPCLGGDGQQP